MYLQLSGSPLMLPQLVLERCKILTIYHTIKLWSVLCLKFETEGHFKIYITVTSSPRALCMQYICRLRSVFSAISGTNLQTKEEKLMYDASSRFIVTVTVGLQQWAQFFFLWPCRIHFAFRWQSLVMSKMVAESFMMLFLGEQSEARQHLARPMFSVQASMG